MFDDGDDDYYSYDDTFYKISDYTGACRFWDGTHPLKDASEKLWNKLVPPEGTATTRHGELLRCVNRLGYDIFNNGLCNGKRPEISSLMGYSYLYRSLLNSEDSLKLLTVLRNLHESGGAIDMNQANCDALDDIMQAIVRYAQQQEELTTIRSQK